MKHTYIDRQPWFSAANTINFFLPIFTCLGISTLNVWREDDAVLCWLLVLFFGWVYCILFSTLSYRRFPLFPCKRWKEFIFIWLLCLRHTNHKTSASKETEIFVENGDEGSLFFQDAQLHLHILQTTTCCVSSGSLRIYDIVYFFVKNLPFHEGKYNGNVYKAMRDKEASEEGCCRTDSLLSG